MIAVAVLVAEAARRLQDAGAPPEDARRDAAIVARALLGWDAATWLMRQGEAAPTDFSERFAELIARRVANEPVAYLTSTREFYGRPFRVTHAVLIPRPETELVVDAALACLREWRAGARAASSVSGSPAIIDVGTGSGCLAVTIALESLGAHVAATDISEAALAVARSNAAALGAAERVSFIHGSILAGRPGPFDLIVSNPPYIPAADAADLAPDVVNYEPHAALFGGRDGLDVVRALIAEAARTLAIDGRLIVEIGAGQSDAVSSILGDGGLARERTLQDLQGIPRVLVARRAVDR